jgi:DnaJ-class molecular chaperone
MHNHYKTLGLTNAASPAEIRRAYRILARRYHPDVNPDGKGEELFKEIALAYSVLSDPEKKRQHDLELKQSIESFAESFEKAHEALKRHQRASAYAKQQREAPKQAPKPTPRSQPQAVKKVKPPKGPSILEVKNLAGLTHAPKVALSNIKKIVSKVRRKAQPKNTPTVGQLALLEVSISILDAIKGTRRTVEIRNPDETQRKVSVFIPPGVRTGSIVRLRNKERPGEEVVLIIRVEDHPWLSITERGLTMDVPLTFAEALEGGKIQVPSLGEPLLVTVDPLTQSGKEVRLKNQGIADRDGTRGDLYIRFTVQVPQKPLPEEIKSLTELLDEAYTHPVREHLPTRILGEET